MADNGWIEFNGTELVNLARTVELADALGIDTVWLNPEDVSWITEQLGGTDYDSIADAPWYDPGYPASAEFAGYIALSFTGLDDNTLESTPTEYIGDGGNSGKSRHGTLPLVANFAIVASTDRGAEYGKRWLDRRLADTGDRVFCVGADLRYFRYRPTETDTSDVPKAHRRNVKITRGTSVTRKRTTDSSATWFVTFTLTAADPYEYGEEESSVDSLIDFETTNLADYYNGSALAPAGKTGWNNTIYEGVATATHTLMTGSGLPAPLPDTFVRKTLNAANGSYLSIGLTNDNPDTTPTLDGFPVTGGKSYTIYWWQRGSVGLSSTKVRSHWSDGVTWTSPGITDTPMAGGPSAANEWKMWSVTLVAPAGATRLAARTIPVLSAGAAIGQTLDYTALVVTETPTLVPYKTYASGPEVISSGTVDLVEESCPVYDYSPIYDPEFPALVASPTAPDFLPDGWTISDGRAFRRYWARVDAPEPSSLRVVPIITLTTAIDARMVRVSVWPSDSATDDQCDPLFSAVVSYLPAGSTFVIDGEQHASYLNGSHPRRTDSLVYSPDANPVQWSSFNDPDSFLVTLDLFDNASNASGFEGDGTVSVSVGFMPKSD